MRENKEFASLFAPDELGKGREDAILEEVSSTKSTQVKPVSIFKEISKRELSVKDIWKEIMKKERARTRPS